MTKKSMNIFVPSLHSRERGLKSHPCCKQHRSFLVAPLAGAWIEILSGNSSRYSSPVAPLAGAWIEIPSAAPPPRPLASLHSRERGLKSLPSLPFVPSLPSLPSRERGLKYEQFRKGAAACFVAPLAGAWIEITSSMALFGTPQSLPSRERGLKSCYVRKVWAAIGRSLRGSVD